MKYQSIDRALYLLSNIRQLIALAKRGHAVTLVTGRTGESRVILPFPSQNFRLETVLLGKKMPALSLLVFDLKAFLRILRLEPLDCVILDVYTLPVFLPMFLFRHFLSGRPALFLRIESNPVDTEGPLQSLLLSILDRFSITAAKLLCNRILFISPMMAELYSRQFGIPAEKVGVWSSSVDTGLFDPREYRGSMKTDRLRRELGISDQMVVLYHGSLSKERGIMETVEAFKILKEESVNVMLIVLGYGPFRDEVARYVRENRLEGAVQVCGPAYSIADVGEYIALCDVGIVPLPDHPWWRYQCSIKTLELLAMNKPLIVSDIPANRSIIGDAPVGSYLAGTSPREIADGIRHFLSIKDSLDPEVGREIAAKFSVDEIAMMLEHQISSAINSRNAKQGVSVR